MYSEYNKRYFGGRLPKIPVKFCQNLDDDEYGYTQLSMNGNGWKVEHIYLNYNQMYGHWKWCRITLLHECAHTDLVVRGHWRASMNHGKMFYREIARLEKAGAYRRQQLL